jgi:anti-sigma factor RsiW
MSDELQFGPVPCEWEARVAETGGNAPDIARHAATCEACSELLAMIEFLRQDTANVAVPSADRVFWKAELRARRESEERALRPLRWMEAGAVVVLAGVAVAAGVTANALPTTIAVVGFCAALGGWWVTVAAGSAPEPRP